MGTVHLPEIKKEVVYVDQFGFSNIMKFLSPEVKGHKRAIAEPLWKELFEILSVVCQLQLVACPDSREHEHESLISPFYKALKHTYEYFSGGISFHDTETIRIRQITTLAMVWIKNEPVIFDFDAQSIISGRVHEWNDRMFVTVDGVWPGAVDEIRARRSRIHDGLQGVFEQWQRDKKSFKDIHTAEKRGFSQMLIQQYAEDCRQRERVVAMIMQGKMPPLDSVLPSRSENLVSNLRFLFQQELGIEEGNVRLARFIKSGAIDETPFNLIGAAMYASLAAKAAAREQFQTKAPQLT